MPVPAEKGRQGNGGPVWRVDLKWVCAIPFTLILLIALLVAVMFTVSGRTRAEETYADMVQPILSDPQSRADLSRVSPEMLVFLEGPDFTAMVFDDPEVFRRGVESLPEAQEGESGNVKGLLSVVSRLTQVVSGPSHASYGRALLILILSSLVPGTLLVVLSRRLGRLVSPAVCLMVAGFPLLMFALAMPTAVSALGISSREEPAEKLAADSLEPLVDSILGRAVSLSGLICLLSLLLLLGAGVWKLAIRYRD